MKNLYQFSVKNTFSARDISIGNIYILIDYSRYRRFFGPSFYIAAKFRS